ncbi:MAG: ice-binding family protein [Crocinitomicaceae bacterium]
MKTKIHKILTAVILLFTPALIYGQAPNLGTTANFVLFSTTGSVSNTGISHLTGKVGTNGASSTGFGNVNGGMHDGDATSAQASTDLLVAYNDLDLATPDYSPVWTAFGGGQVLTPGVYYISAPATLDLDLTLDGENDPNAVFIFQIEGAFSTSAQSKVKLINQTQACNVFWKVEGQVDMATGTTMRGTIVANNAAINMNTGDTLEGRALAIAGAITIDGVLAYTPIGCGSPVLTGPAAPVFGEVGCYGIFSSDGPVENAGITNVVGDVGCNVGLTSGFDSLLVTGNIHPIPDGSTAAAASDLITVYNYLNTLTHDIELLYPAQFGANLVLTPHTYLLDAATTFTDTLYLNAQGNADAVFVMQIEGALSTSTYSKVILTNGTQAKNVYWLVNGAVEINDYSVFNGTIVSQGAINLFTGVTINGRALTGVGALSTSAIDAAAAIDVSNCETVVGGPVSVDEFEAVKTVSIYPNPFQNSVTIRVENTQNEDYTFKVYNSLGAVVYQTILINESTTLNLSELNSGAYFYRVMSDSQLIKSGKLLAQ